MNLYFVCTGNTCRSPMAEAILKSKQLPHISVKSAGIYAMDGVMMSTNAQQVLNEENIPHQHRSKLFTKKEMEWADLILTMTEGHKNMIVQSFEEAKTKTYTLKEFVGERGDVLDPYGGSIQTYRETYKQLKQLIEQLKVEKVTGHGKI